MALTHNRFRTSGIDVVKSYTNIKKAVLLWTTISLVDEVWSWLVGLLQLHPLETLKCARRKWQTSANQRAVKDQTTFHNHYEPTTKARQTTISIVRRLRQSIRTTESSIWTTEPD